MASARINNSGTGVKIRLSFREAAALWALIARVGPDTHQGINEVTMDLWGKLTLVRDELDTETPGELWPEEFDEFANKNTALLDFIEA